MSSGRPKKPNKRECVVAVRLTEEEHTRATDYAEAKGIALATWTRLLILKEIKR